MNKPLVDLLLSIADDKLFLGHRNSDWTGLAPILEEDIAFSSIAQDEIAHASALYEEAAPLAGSTADDLAFGRSESEFRNAAIVEVPDEFDWATAIARQFFCDHFDLLRLQRLAESSEPKLAALSKRLVAEERVHVEHVDQWMRRLGRGTKESHDRLQSALEALAPHAVMLAEPVDGQAMLEETGVYPPLSGNGDLFEQWAATLADVIDDAGLKLDIERPEPDRRGGRRGTHTAHMTTMLDEMCEVYRVEPGVPW